MAKLPEPPLTPKKAAKKAASTPAVAAPTLNVKQAAKRVSKAKSDSLKMRKQLWPGVSEFDLWLREKEHGRKGYTTVPRTLSLLMNLIQDVSKQVTSGKSVPAGRTYLVLWCRVFDEGFLSIDAEAMAALEAGYSGERNISTWREHMKVLRDLGFIDYKPGPSGPCQYVLIYNPYRTVLAMKAKGWVQNDTYMALYQRSLEIGATDLDEFADLY